MIVAVLGFPGAGKTTYLRGHLHPANLREGIETFVQFANPDGEGNWTVESGRRDLRRKGVYTERFVQHVMSDALNLAKKFDIVYLDCGGRISAENERIVSICDEAIVVGITKEDMAEWERFVLDRRQIPIQFVRSFMGSDGLLTFHPVKEE